MILADTGVLIRHFRQPDAGRQRLIESVRPLVCGMVVAEFLSGARTAVQSAGCAALLSYFDGFATPERTWERAGRLQAALGAARITVPLADAIIAALAAETGRPLWTYDTHFTLIRSMEPAVTLFEEP